MDYTQDILTVIDRRNPIFFDMNTYRLNRSVGREYSNHTSFDYVNCPICGLYYARAFFEFCSSFCDSIANKNGYFLSKVVFLPCDEDSPDLEEWYVLEENLIRSEMKRIKRAKRLTRYEKKLMLQDLSDQLVILNYYTPKREAV